MTVEEEWIAKARKGDSAALAMLFQQHYGFLTKYLFKVTMDMPTAEDLTQETLLRAMEKLHLYNGRSKFSSWLITIGTRLYIDEQRKKKRERGWQERERAQALRRMQWQAAQQGSDWPEALAALQNLSDEVRLPIILKYYYGYAQEEIAGIMDVSVGTIKSRIHYGLKRLRKEMDGYDEA